MEIQVIRFKYRLSWIIKFQILKVYWHVQFPVYGTSIRRKTLLNFCGRARCGESSVFLQRWLRERADQGLHLDFLKTWPTTMVLKWHDDIFRDGIAATSTPTQHCFTHTMALKRQLFAKRKSYSGCEVSLVRALFISNFWKCEKWHFKFLIYLR